MGSSDAPGLQQRQVVQPAGRWFAELNGASPQRCAVPLQVFLEGLPLTAGQRGAILFIIQHLGFKEELAAGGGADGTAANPCPRAFAVVQDADR